MEEQIEKEQIYDEINSHIVFAIITMIFCCIPVGIVSLVYAARAESALAVNNMSLAKTAADKAKFWAKAAIFSGVAAYIIIFAAVIVSIVVTAKNSGQF